MHHRSPLLFALLPLVVLSSLTGCDRPKVTVVEVAPATPAAEPVAQTKTLETQRLGAAIDRFQQEPTEVQHAAVKKALAELEGEIAELEALVAKRSGAEQAEAAAKLQNLRSYRDAELLRLNAAAPKPVLPAGPLPDARTGAEKVEDSVERVGNSLENAARKTGDAIKDAVR